MPEQNPLEEMDRLAASMQHLARQALTVIDQQKVCRDHGKLVVQVTAIQDQLDKIDDELFDRELERQLRKGRRK